MAEGYHDFTAGETLTAANLEDYCMLQSIPRFASSAARDSALSAVLIEGLTAYCKDTNSITIYTGAVWTTLATAHGAFGSWTPTVTQTGSVTVTNTYSRIQRQGRLISGWFSLAVTGSGSGGTPILISVPLTAVQADIEVGTAQAFDSSVNTYYHCFLHMENTGAFSMRSTAGAVGDQRLGVSVFSGGLASGDILRGQFHYEASAD